MRVLALGRAAMQVTVPATAACRHRVDERFFVLPAGVDVISIHTRFLGSRAADGAQRPGDPHRPGRASSHATPSRVRRGERRIA